MSESSTNNETTPAPPFPGGFHRDAMVEVWPPRGVTEPVPWHRAMGRRTAWGVLLGEIAQAYPSPLSPAGIYVEYVLPELGTTGNPSRNPDGTVNVLVEARPDPERTVTVELPESQAVGLVIHLAGGSVHSILLKEAADAIDAALADESRFDRHSDSTPGRDEDQR